MQLHEKAFMVNADLGKNYITIKCCLTLKSVGAAHCFLFDVLTRFNTQCGSEARGQTESVQRFEVAGAAGAAGGRYLGEEMKSVVGKAEDVEEAADWPKGDGG